MRLALFLLAASLVGCTLPKFGEDPLDFKVDAAFGDDEPFRRAGGKWDLFTHPSNRITFGHGPWTIVEQDPGTGYNGGTSNEERTIRIKPGADPYLTSIHEFGHALGLHHTATGVMNPLEPSDAFTPEVLEECKHVGACP